MPLKYVRTSQNSKTLLPEIVRLDRLLTLNQRNIEATEDEIERWTVGSAVTASDRVQLRELRRIRLDLLARRQALRDRVEAAA